MSTYQFMDHADWVEKNNRALKRTRGRRCQHLPDALTEFQKIVCDILGMVGGGIYNAPINHENIQWDESYAHAIRVVWRHEMASFDFDELTKLVFLCHTARIRVAIDGCGPHMIRLTFSERKAEGDIAVRHPNLAEAVAVFEKYLPPEHRVRFQKGKPK